MYICCDLTMGPLLLQEGATFDTWNSFQTTIDKYSKARHMQFCFVNSRTVVAANKLLTPNSTQYTTKIKYAYINKTLSWLFTIWLPCVHYMVALCSLYGCLMFTIWLPCVHSYECRKETEKRKQKKETEKGKQEKRNGKKETGFSDSISVKIHQSFT